MTWEVLEGDVRRVCRGLDPESYDACLSDPPYGISFMGRRWDYRVPSANFWVEVLRVLRPGAHAIIFGGSRTYHRMACAVEDAGFWPVDMLEWMYGKGFPHGLDLSKALDKREGHWRGRAGKPAAHDARRAMGQHYERTPKGEPVTVTVTAAAWRGYGTQLKPAHEPALLACKPSPWTIAETALRHGVGGLAIDACRVGASGGTAGRDYEKTGLFGMGGKATIEQIGKGRWPANVVLSHHPGCRPAGTKRVNSGKAIRRRSGGKNAHHDAPKPPLPDMGYGGDQDGTSEVVAWECHEDCPAWLVEQMSEGASRFFYCTKAGRPERDRGLEGTAPVAHGVGALRDGGRASREVLNDHPTVKPLKVTRYWARLLLPPPRPDGRPRRLLVPCSGSGSEMIGALQAGWDHVTGIELDPGHAEKARRRIARGKIIQHQ